MLGHQPSFKHYLYVAASNIATLIAVVVGTILIVALAQGYRYDVASGEVSLSGLLRIESSPVTAEVFIDGESTGERTGFRRTVEQGLHTVTLKSQGYRDWQKEIQIRGGLVEWLQYPRLIPEVLQEKAVLAQPANQFFSFSPTGDYALRGTPQSLEILDLTNVSEVASAVQITTDTASNVASVHWNKSNQALLRITTSTGQQTVILNAAASELTDVTQLTAEFKPVALLEDQIIARKLAHDLWSIQRESNQITPLAANIALFSTDNNQAAWLEDNLIKVWDGEQTITVDSAQKNIKNISAMKLFNYDEKTNLALQTTDGGVVLENILGTLNDRSFTAATVLIGISPNGQFVLYETKTGYSSYDFDEKRVYQFSPETKFTNLRWADNFSLFAEQEGQVVLMEFDGGNRQLIMPLKQQQSIALSGSGRSLYVLRLNPQTSTNVLNKINLLVQDN